MHMSRPSIPAHPDSPMLLWLRSVNYYIRLYVCDMYIFVLNSQLVRGHSVFYTWERMDTPKIYVKLTINSFYRKDVVPTPLTSNLRMVLFSAIQV